MKHSKAPWIVDDVYGLIMSGEAEICALHSGIKENARLIWVRLFNKQFHFALKLM